MIRPRNLFLAAQCLYRRITSGTARAPLGSVRRVVVVQLAQLGDMVCTTPVFRAIKKHYPQAHLTVVGKAPHAELLTGNTDVDAFIAYRGDVQAVIKQLRSQHYDVGCTATPGFLGLAMLYLGGIPRIAAPQVVKDFCPQQTLLYRWLLRWVIVVPFSFGLYMPRLLLTLLEPMGITDDDTTKHLAYSAQAQQRVQTLMAGWKKEGAPLIGLSPSSGNKIKNWDPKRFAQLATDLCRRYQAAVVVIGGPSDRHEVSELFTHLSSDLPVYNVAEHLTIDELKALIASLDYFIAVDTGPIYIAEAFGVPTLDVIGPVDEREQPPMGPCHRLVYLRDRKQAIVHILNARVFDVARAREQIEGITVEMVEQEFDDLYKECHK